MGQRKRSNQTGCESGDFRHIIWHWMQNGGIFLANWKKVFPCLITQPGPSLPAQEIPFRQMQLTERQPSHQHSLTEQKGLCTRGKYRSLCTIFLTYNPPLFLLPFCLAHETAPSFIFHALQRSRTYQLVCFLFGVCVCMLHG